MNKAFMVGRATKDGELKVTPRGVNVGEFTLAVDRGFGENKKTDFIRCAVFGKASENVKNYVKKGDVLSVVGEISCYAWKDVQTNEYKTQISVNVSDWKIEAHAQKSDGTQKSEQPSFEDFLEVNNENIPF